jgi:hypothetical protein
MKALLKKYLVFLLSVATVGLTIPPPLAAKGDLSYGKQTADEAAAPESPIDRLSTTSFGTMRHVFAFADTTEYEFPEEEEGREHLWRDVALWVVVAGFVAFFVIKVFLQGDTDEPAEEKPGKEIPPTSLTVPQPAGPARGSP